jgi:pimeloyl-ACP methyl ester carboxylesterase
MIVALQAYREAIGARKLVLVGYSGGGTLAWLMAARIPDVVAVVTVAANLDVELWTSLHGYTPMAGSLNPADSPPLSPSVKQVHYVGGRDRNVPPQVTRSFGAHHASARVVEIPDFDHTCCWVENWPDLLRAAELP